MGSQVDLHAACWNEERKIGCPCKQNGEAPSQELPLTCSSPFWGFHSILRNLIPPSSLQRPQRVHSAPGNGKQKWNLQCSAPVTFPACDGRIRNFLLGSYPWIQLSPKREKCLDSHWCNLGVERKAGDPACNGRMPVLQAVHKSSLPKLLTLLGFDGWLCRAIYFCAHSDGEQQQPCISF